jgi:hypothetical protein
MAYKEALRLIQEADQTRTPQHDFEETVSLLTVTSRIIGLLALFTNLMIDAIMQRLVRDGHEGITVLGEMLDFTVCFFVIAPICVSPGSTDELGRIHTVL